MRDADGDQFTRTGRHLVAAFTVALALGTGPAGAQTLSCGKTAEQIFAAADVDVVEIFSIGINQFRVSGRTVAGLGTGFVLKSGVIVTNYHVIADARFLTITDDDWSYDAEIVGVDPMLDIAVLKSPMSVLQERGIELAAPDSLRVGQKVFPIGYPRGFGKSISEGIVTGLGRVLADTTHSWLSPMIQTDATINPGNSGGPLLDDCGRAIGMVTRAALPAYAENIGFAIPVSVLGPIVDEIVATGHVSRAWHGLYGQMVVPPIMAMLGTPQDAWFDATGFMVETVEPGSAADRAGLHGGDWPIRLGGREYLMGGDIITEVDGRAIDNLDTALEVVRNLKIGQTISLTYLRNTELHSVSVTLAERPVLEADLNQYRDTGP